MRPVIESPKTYLQRQLDSARNTCESILAQPENEYNSAWSHRREINLDYALRRRIALEAISCIPEPSTTMPLSDILAAHQTEVEGVIERQLKKMYRDEVVKVTADRVHDLMRDLRKENVLKKWSCYLPRDREPPSKVVPVDRSRICDAVVQRLVPELEYASHWYKLPGLVLLKRVGGINGLSEIVLKDIVAKYAPLVRETIREIVSEAHRSAA